MTIEDDNEVRGFWLDTSSNQFDYWGFEYNYGENVYYNQSNYTDFKNSVEYKVIDMICYLKRTPCE